MDIALYNITILDTGQSLTASLSDLKIANLNWTSLPIGGRYGTPIFGPDVRNVAEIERRRYQVRPTYLHPSSPQNNIY